MYDLKVEKQAAKYPKKLDKPNQKRLMNALMALAENPFADASVKRMKGYTSTFRKRVGDFRIIFDVDQGQPIVLVWRLVAVAIFIKNRKTPSLFLKKGRFFLYRPILSSANGCIRWNHKDKMCTTIDFVVY